MPLTKYITEASGETVYNLKSWGNIYFDADATNELYKRSDNYENSNGTDEILRDIPRQGKYCLNSYCLR